MDVHPSELAYAFSYARVEAVIGWGSAPFLPPDGADGALAEWYAEGAERLLAAGRLTGDPEAGLTVSDEMTAAVLALADPGLVLLSQRKAGEEVRTLTVHGRGGDYFGLTLRPEGLFELTRYGDLTAAAGAAAGFVGATLTPPREACRIEANRAVFARLGELSRNGEGDRVATALQRLGADEAAAQSAASALARPAAAGVLSVLYCANAEVQDAEAYTVATSAGDESWVLFAPADPDGSMLLERSSAADLTARVAVGVAARLSAPG